MASQGWEHVPHVAEEGVRADGELCGTQGRQMV
ncbi:MAG: hypothetical protein IJG13_18525 [Kiritimatiellae bacterium]|nr:hypothetical protein [Kiritimatiellia bacterium]